MGNARGTCRIVVLHGPHLQSLGTREPEQYGRITLRQLNARLRLVAQRERATLTCRQHDDEAALLAAIAAASRRYQAVVINPAAFTHTSTALRDAVSRCSLPVIEVHLSNLAAREPFRRHSYLAAVAQGTIFGMGVLGYEVAVLAAIRLARGDASYTVRSHE